MKNLYLLLILLGSIWVSGCQTLRARPDVVNTTYANFGDSVAYGAMAIPIEKKSYAALVADFLEHLHPHVTLANCGWPGRMTGDYSGAMPSFMKQIAKLPSGPLKRATLLIGLSDLVQADHKSTPAQVVAFSQTFKEITQRIIDAILKPNPGCQLVLCNFPDPNNGGKGPRDPYLPPTVIQEFNKRIAEMAEANKLQVADLYGGMMGHPEYFLVDGHPNNLGHAKIATIIEGVFEPGQTIEASGNTTTAAIPTFGYIKLWP